MRDYTVNFPYNLSSYDWFRLHPYVITVTSCCDLPHQPDQRKTEYLDLFGQDRYQSFFTSRLQYFAPGLGAQ